MDVSPLLVGVESAAAALAGVAINQRGVAREARAARAESRRDGQRRIIADLLIAGLEKVSRYELLLPLFGKWDARA